MPNNINKNDLNKIQVHTTQDSNSFPPSKELIELEKDRMERVERMNEVSLRFFRVSI